MAKRQCCYCRRSLGVDCYGLRSRLDDLTQNPFAGLTRFAASRLTFTVRTGRRPDFAVHGYFQGNTDSFNGWKDGEFSGDKRGSWGYVLAPGSHHKSGERYEILWDLPVAPVPGWVRDLKMDKERKERVLSPTEIITEWRNDAMIRILGKAREAGLSDDFDPRARRGRKRASDERKYSWRSRTQTKSSRARASMGDRERSAARCSLMGAKCPSPQKPRSESVPFIPLRRGKEPLFMQSSRALVEGVITTSREAVRR